MDDPSKPLSVTIRDEILLYFIDKYCTEMQWKRRDFVKHVLYKFFDDKGFDVSRTRPDLK